MVCQVVERWNSFARIRQDLFNFIDIVCLGEKIIGIQATSGSNHSRRREKILAEPKHKLWLEAGGKIVLASWSKYKVKRGGKAVHWMIREEWIET